MKGKHGKKQKKKRQKMSKNLYCPKCKNEYFGEVKSANPYWNDYKNDCSCNCGYIFTLKDFEKAK